MTSIQQLKEKHLDLLLDNEYQKSIAERRVNLHSNISIQFAIECLEEVMLSGTEYFSVSNIDIQDKINELKQYETI